MEHRIASTLDFDKLIMDKYLTTKRSYWVFRGISSVNFKLIPSVGRIEYTSKSFEKFEESIFDIFKRNAVQYVSQHNLNDYEWLALAQHHGLPTRLLDWSFNPNVALFFACRERFDSDSYFYALNAPTKHPDHKIKTIAPFKLRKPVKLLAPSVTTRIFLQEGLFTISSEPRKPLEDELPEDWRIEKILIPKEEKNKCFIGYLDWELMSPNFFPI